MCSLTNANAWCKGEVVKTVVKTVVQMLGARGREGEREGRLERRRWLLLGVGRRERERERAREREKASEREGQSERDRER